MTAEILTIGDELLIGQTVNTNAAWLGEHLDALGVTLARTSVVGDDEAAIVAELDGALGRADLVVTTGGLGPTHDDVTKEAVARCFDAGLRFDEETFRRIRARFERRGVAMPESNRTQAMVPEGFDVLPNPAGTAPGLWFEGAWAGRTRRVVVLPGVPHEMRGLFEGELVPRLREAADLRVTGHRTLHTAGIGESSLQEKVGDVSDLLGPATRLAYLPGSEGVRLRLTAHGEDRSAVEARLDRLERRLRERAGAYVFGTGAETLEGVLGGLLEREGLTLAVAESCSGGHILNRLTNISGSSAYVVGGVVAYCNSVKVELLDVDEKILEEEGAVCAEVARQMARGVRRHMGSDLGLSTTGIAGPTGGTPDKPVGTVWVGYADAQGEDAVLFNFVDDRLLNKELTVTYALDLVRRRLDG